MKAATFADPATWREHRHELLVLRPYGHVGQPRRHNTGDQLRSSPSLAPASSAASPCLFDGPADLLRVRPVALEPLALI